MEPNKPHGCAPDCSFYSANSADYAALRWALENPRLCTVISQSFHRGGTPQSGQDEEGSGILSPDDILKDHLATILPYPTIIHAACNLNGLSVEYVNHKGFNTLSVGSHNDTATAMAPDSVFLNPTSAHGDRELPELCANGTSVSAVGSRRQRVGHQLCGAGCGRRSGADPVRQRHA